MLTCCVAVGNFFSCQENRQVSRSISKNRRSGLRRFSKLLEVEVDASPPAAAPPAAMSPARPEIEAAPSPSAPASPTASAAAASGVGTGGRCGQGRRRDAGEAQAVGPDGANAVDHEHGHDGARRDNAAPKSLQQRYEAVPCCPSGGDDSFSHVLALHVLFAPLGDAGGRT
jgi:hypothetical protein